MEDKDFLFLKSEIGHLEKKFDDNAKFLKSELERQAKEYERRLQDLNHEAARIFTVQTSSVSQDVYEERNRGTDGKLVKIDDKLLIIDKWMATENGKKAVYAIILVVVMFAINFFKTDAINANKSQTEVYKTQMQALEKKLNEMENKQIKK